MKTKILLSALLASNLAFAQSVSLSQAYEMALENNNELKMTMSNSMASQERLSQATAMFLPTINAEAAYVGEKYDRMDRRRVSKINESYKKVGVSLSQSVFRPAIWYQRNQEEIRVRGNELMYENTKQELAKRVVEAYFNYTFASETLALAQSYEEANRAKYNQMQKSLEFGLVNKMDMLESKVRLDEALLGVNKAKLNIEVAKLELVKLVGQEIEVKDSFSNIDTEFFKKVNLSNFSDVARNFKFQDSVLAVEISEQEYKKRKSEHLPTLDFSISYANLYYIDNNYSGDRRRKLDTMLRFTLPLYTGGATSSRVEEGKLLRLASIEQQKDIQKEIEISQKRAINNYLNYIDECELMKRSLENAELYVKSIERGYEEGLKDAVNLFDARARVFKTRNEALTASYNLVLAYLEIQWLNSNISVDMMRDLQRAFR